ncbi:helix-turn-helix domain-containing protein [Myroides odoratus]|uniref:helix-turn-helix domain-containing protein n=1 Tax=Myroides odoratus TaxID=256 RepID=UPI000765A412|nr:AraC family transcriptional regulator [Myroides odoratus]
MHLLKISELNTQYQVFYPFLMEEFFLVEAQDETTLSFFELQYQFRGLVLVYCTQGSLLIKMNKVDYHVEQEAILTILPEMTVEPLSYSEDFRATVFLMSYDFIEKFTILPEFISNTEVLNSPLLYATAQDQEMIEELMTLIVKYYRQPKTILLNQLIQYLVFSLLTGVAKSYQSLTKKENLQKNRINQITDAFFELLQEHGDLQRQVSFYAEQLHLTPQHLNSLIKKRTGKSIKSWIGFVVINKAKEYLTMTSLSIKEISDKMEFADASLFCRYFKRYIGQTPNAYRNQ